MLRKCNLNNYNSDLLMNVRLYCSCTSDQMGPKLNAFVSPFSFLFINCPQGVASATQPGFIIDIGWIRRFILAEC